MAADLFITCSCSQKISVTPADCGGTLRCNCGRVVDVPRLSQMRESSDREANQIVELIKKGIADGTLLGEQNCVLCGKVTSNSILCEVSLEQRTFNEGGGRPDPLVYILSPWIWLWLVLRGKPAESYNRDPLVTVPMRACERCAKIIRYSRRKRTNALLKTDLYRELFATYSNASSAIVDPKKAEFVKRDPDAENPYSYK